MYIQIRKLGVSPTLLEEFRQKYILIREQMVYMLLEIPVKDYDKMLPYVYRG